MNVKKYTALFCVAVSLVSVGCGTDTKSAENVKQTESQKADAGKTERDKMITEITTGWNTETTDADKDNTNWEKATDLIKKYPDYIRQADEYSPSPETMLKKPWDYYGKVVSLKGRIYSVEQRPPGHSVVKFFGQDCYHAMFVPSSDKNVTFSADIIGANDNLRDDAIITLRGYIYGHRGLVNTTFGGKSKGLGFVGFVDTQHPPQQSAQQSVQNAPPLAVQSGNNTSPSPQRQSAPHDSVYLGNYSDGSPANLLKSSVNIQSNKPYNFTCTIESEGDYLNYHFFPNNGSPYYTNTEGYEGYVFGKASPIAAKIYRYVVNNY